MRRQMVRATYNNHKWYLSPFYSYSHLTLLALSWSLLVKINLCYFVVFWSGDWKSAYIIWGLTLICLKPVEETYDKGSAFKMFKVRNSSRAVVVTPFLNTPKAVETLRYIPQPNLLYSFRSRFQLQVWNVKCCNVHTSSCSKENGLSQ